MKKNKSDLRDLIQKFITNIVEHISDDITQKTNKWLIRVKKRTAGAALIILGITFLLTGVAVYANTVFEKVAPGVGYAIVGLAIISIGYLTSKD